MSSASKTGVQIFVRDIKVIRDGSVIKVIEDTSIIWVIRVIKDSRAQSRLVSCNSY